MTEVLFLTHRLPYPPNKGEKIRAWHFLRRLSEEFTLHLGSFMSRNEAPQHLDLLREHCGETCFVPTSDLPLNWRSLAALASRKPISLGHFQSVEMQRWVKDLTARRKPEAVFAYSGTMAQFVPAGIPNACRRIIDFVDVDSWKWERYAEDISRPGLDRWVYEREARLLAQHERKTALAFDASLFVSKHESKLFQSRVPEARSKVVTIENGVDLEKFRPGLRSTRPASVTDNCAVFVGSMDYRPNVEGTLWFCEEVLPEILNRFPDFRFLIVGANPPPKLRRLGERAEVTVTGAIEAVPPYLEHAQLVVVPLKLSPGIPNKILEAMAMAKAVVTTPAAIQGLERVEPDRDLLVAADATSFAELVTGLLENPASARKIGENARATVLAHYTWEKNLERLAQLVAGPPGRILDAE